LDKYEYKVRADEIKELIAQGNYVQAAEIADTIDWRRVKSVMMLCTISDLYKINRRYEDARDMLLLAYDRRPGGRTICYSLCELSIKMEEYVQAVEYYKEFVQAAPKDPGRYILQYKIYEAQDVSLEERIEVLEELKKRDYREKWAYELAYLYHRVGLATRCVEECDEMILWFGEGKYVIKAMELKRLHQPLTPAQQEKYDKRFESNKTVEEVEVPVAVAQKQPLPAPQEEEDTISYDTVPLEDVLNLGDVDIQVKTMDVGAYNTINLQAELAAGLREVLEHEKAKDNIENPITKAIMAPMLESDTESLDYPQIDEVSEEDLDLTGEEMEHSEIFFGATGEITTVKNKQENQLVLQDAEEDMEEPENIESNATAEAVMEQMRLEETGEKVETVLNAEPPKELAQVLSQEADGQLSLVMPEKENIEKQITGQMSIEDILAEWERMKKENEEKRKEEVRQHVLQQTGTMFTEFEAAVRDGLLEQLESGKIDGDISETVSEEIAETEEELLEEEAVESEEETLGEETVEAEEEPLEEEIVEAEEESLEEETAEPEEESLEEEVVEPEEEDAAETEDIVWDVEDVYPEEDSQEAQEEDVEDSEEEPSKEAVIEGEINFEEEDAPEEVVEEAVVRDKPTVRTLTREERELYAPFIQSKKDKEQLISAIDNISLAAYTGNIVITGEEGMNILSLAKNMIREVQMTDSNFSGKIAKISGSALNKKDVTAVVKDFKNGALMIQKATEMDEKTVSDLTQALQQETMGIIIVLLDTRKAISRFFAEYKELASCFTATMDVEALSNDALVAFGQRYAYEMEYGISEVGMLELHTRVAALQTSDHIVTIAEVKEIVDEAIRRANKKTVGHFFDVLLGRRYDEEDMIVLTEKDFM